MFHVGQMVVCVDDIPNPDYRAVKHKMPVRGNVYTIRQHADPLPGSDVPGILLEEIINPIALYAGRGWHEVTFHPRRFRPVKKTSIDCFTAVLAPTPKQQVTA